MSRGSVREYSFRMNSTARLLQDLVRIPSINPMGRAVEGPTYLEGRVADYLVEFFRGLSVRCERQAIQPGRDNVVACFDSPESKHTLIFEAHQDTVPVDGMTVDPFAGEMR